MSRAIVRLLAATTACATLAALSTAPAQAAGPIEATAVPYAFSGDQGQEAVTIENSEWRLPLYASGRTPAHPGWDIRLSDETVGAGLPRQDTVAIARNDATRPFASTRGFISIMDDNANDVPFLVVKLGERWTDCQFSMGADLGRLFVRKSDGELYESDVNNVAYAGDVSAAHTATGTTRHNVNVKVNILRSPSQVASFNSFAKYQNRPSTTMNGVEIVLDVYTEGTVERTYRVLAGATAASC